MSSTLRIKKLNPKAVVPSYATQGSNGLDLTCTEVKIVEDHKGLNNIIVCHTGLAVEIEPGFVGLLFPRSSISDMPLSLANSVGVIDSDYRGEILLKFKFTGHSFVQWTRNIYEVGQRVGQLVVVPFEQPELLVVDELSSTARGVGGYGSTGK